MTKNYKAFKQVFFFLNKSIRYKKMHIKDRLFLWIFNYCSDDLWLT